MKSRHIWGFILILLGIGFFLDQLDLLRFSDVISSWWPLIIIASGVYTLINNKGSYIGGLIILTVGILLQVNNLDFLPYGFWGTLWPLILVILGIGILTSRHKKFKKRILDKEKTSENFNIFSESKRVVETEYYNGGEISTFFGSSEIDLSNSTMSTEGAVLDVTVAFGSVDIRIPPNWKIQSSGFPLFGGFSDKTTKIFRDNEINPVLKIRYFVMFGSVEITN